MTYERNCVRRFRCMLPFFYFYQQYAITQMLPSQRFEGRRREGEREMTAVAGFYRRILPSPPAIEFASLEGKQLFSEAFQEGNAEGFFILISYYQTQSEPAYCGLSTLSMVLNALGIDPGRKWKGPWRWFDDSMLDCCEPLEKIKANGISFGKVACLANCNGAKVEAFRANESSIHHFRKSVISCTSSGDCHVIVSYHRKYLNQTGGGHFSPIGAYHAERDMVLILDVARFKYPPHWVPLSLLWTAMNTVDEATGQHRGFMLVTRLERAPSILFTMSCRYESWSATAEYLAKEVSQLLSTKEIRDIQELLAVLFTSAPSDLRDFINWVVEVQRQDDRSESEVIGEEEKERLSIKAELLEQVRKTLLYSHIAKWLATESCCKYVTSSATKDSFGEVAATVCCEGAHFLFGKFVPSNGSCGKTTDVRLSKDGGDTQLTLVTESNGQDANALVPCSQENKEHLCGCSANPSTGRHPSNEDVLTVLVLALPPNTWSGIRDKKLREEICGIVSVEKLPSLLQEEVLHLRRQLHLLSSECRIFLSST